MAREKMSRPSSSVPSRCFEPGPIGRPSGSRPVLVLVFVGSVPNQWVSRGAQTAIKRIRTMTTAEMMAILSWRNRAQASCQGVRPLMARACSAATGGTSASRSVRLMVTSWLGARERRLGGLLLDRGPLFGQTLTHLDREMAGGDVVGRVAARGDEHRLLHGAALLRLGAAGVEAAAGRRVDRRRDVA